MLIVYMFLCWSIFILFNTMGDAIEFYRVFVWYKNRKLWHTFKYIWIAGAVGTGVFFGIFAQRTNPFVWLTTIVALCWYRLFLHEGLMFIWRKGYVKQS